MTNIILLIIYKIKTLNKKPRPQSSSKLILLLKKVIK
jgi:hypothetical protein